jgi:lipoate-protein ligase B
MKNSISIHDLSKSINKKIDKFRTINKCKISSHETEKRS